MKTWTFATLAVAAVTVGAMTVSERAGSYYQPSSGQASFTHYSGCGQAGTFLIAPFACFMI